MLPSFANAAFVASVSANTYNALRSSPVKDAVPFLSVTFAFDFLFFFTKNLKKVNNGTKKARNMVF